MGEEELDDLFAEIDNGSRVVSEQEIIKEIQTYRKEKKAERK